MITKTFTILNQSGFSERPAGVLCDSAKDFSSDVKFNFNGKYYDVKNATSILSSNAKCGEEITFIVDGPDEDDLITVIENGINSKFGEER